MSKPEHFQCLENMYQSAGINDWFEPTMVVTEGQTKISVEVQDHHKHAAGAVHGSVYFKMLDDAAYFAANSLEDHYFLVTTTFTTYLTRPVTQGQLTSVGKVVNQTRSQFIAEAVLYDENDKEIGRGHGVFVRSRSRLAEVSGYA